MRLHALNGTRQSPIRALKKSSMKPLFFPIVFAFCFVIMLAGTKAVPTDETPSIDRSQKYACNGRPLPSAARP